jgi:MlaD protein
MPVQDLTPQLRTRLSRVERAVGWFVVVATILLLAGFAYYVYHTAQRKGWFLLKLPYNTVVQSAAGLHRGDAVMMMGFDIGQITEITPMPPGSTYGNVYVQFTVRQPYYGYLWSDSYVKLVASGLLGNRSLEVVQGGTSTNKTLYATYKTDEKAGKVLGELVPDSGGKYTDYKPGGKGYCFPPATESPPITDRLEQIANQAQQALPGIFDLTNQINVALSNIAQLTTHADNVMLQARPIVTNFAIISGFLTNGPGALGEWLIPTNINRELRQTLAIGGATLTNANRTLITANSSLTTLSTGLDQSLVNVANITSNLNAQVQRNDQILTQISGTIVHADQFVQGLKRFWLFRHLFRGQSPTPVPAALPVRAPAVTPPPASPLPGTNAAPAAPAAAPSAAAPPANAQNPYPMPARSKTGHRFPP